MIRRHILPCILLLTAAVVPLNAQDTLRWKFQSGETLKYSVQQTMKTHMETAAGAQDMTTNQTMEMSWKVAGMTPGGDAVVGQQIDRVQLSMEGGVYGAGVKFDSSDSGAPTHPIVKAISDVFRKIIGQPFNVTMRPSGKVVDVAVPPQLLESLKTTGGGATNPLNEDVLKQMMTQSSVTFPESAVTVGQTWDTSQKIDLPFGSMVVTSRLTYEGRDAETGLAQIAMAPSVAVQPNPSSPIQLQLKDNSGTGRILFDAQSGRIVRSDLKLDMELQITQFGQTMTQKVEQQTSMQLAR